MLGEWVKNVPKRSNYITNFLGINYTENYKEGELAEGFGLSTEKYPCLYQRKGRSKIREDVTDIFEWDGKLIFVSGGVLFYDGREITSVSSDRKQFAVVNTKLIVWPDKIIVDLTSGEFRRMDTSLETTVTIDEDSVTVVRTDKKHFWSSLFNRKKYNNEEKSYHLRPCPRRRRIEPFLLPHPAGSCSIFTRRFAADNLASTTGQYCPW